MTKDVITKMTALVYQQLRNIPHEHVEDIVQEAMLKVHMHYDKYKEASIKTYAYIAIKTQIIEYLDSRKKGYSVCISPTILDNNVFESNENVEAEYERSAKVKEILNLLNDEDRTLIELYYFSGYTMEEIAEFFNAKSDTTIWYKQLVDIRLQRVIKKLQIILK